MQRAVNVCVYVCLCLSVSMLVSVCEYLLVDGDDQDEYWTQVLRDHKYGAFPISTIAPSVTAGVEVCVCL